MASNPPDTVTSIRRLITRNYGLNKAMSVDFMPSQGVRDNGNLIVNCCGIHMGMTEAEGLMLLACLKEALGQATLNRA